jgi:nucleoid-associated protein YgaU
MTKRLLRASGAGFILIALTFGVPILLLAFGRSPLDGDGSLWDQLSSLPGQTVSDNVAFGVLTLAAWLAWAVFAVQVVAEMASALGAGVRWGLLSSGPFEVPVRRLVLAITLAASLTQRGGMLPTLPAGTQEAVATVDAAHLPARPPEDASAGLNEAPATPIEAHLLQASRSPQQVPAEPSPPHDPITELPQVIVAAGDTPWDLAERHLGQGLRWREIWDLNRGVRQVDDRAWVTEDLIQPGWCFRLPADAVGVPALPSLPPAADPQGPETQPAPHGEEHGEPSDAADDPTPAPPTSTAPSTTSSTSTLPPTSSTPPPSEPDSPADTTASTSEAPVANDDRRSVGDDDPEDDGSGIPVVLLGAAGTLLAVGAVRELRRRRMRRSVGMPAGALPPPPIRVPIDAELVGRADETMADRLDAAVSHLAAGLRPRSNHDCVQPKVVQVRENRIDVMLDRPDPAPPPPWRPEASGLIWVLDGDEQLPAIDDASPLPALVTLGVDDSEVMLDLEAFGVVSLVGDEAACRSTVRSMVAELSTRGTGVVSVEVVGRPVDETSERLDGVLRRRGWDEVDTSTVTDSIRLLETGQWPHTWAARSSGLVYDGWAPTVWVTEGADHPAYADAVQAIARRPGAGSAVVVVGSDAGTGLRIYLDGHGGFEIPELGLSGAAQGVGADVVEQIADLLDDAETPAGSTVVTLPPVCTLDDDDHPSDAETLDSSESATAARGQLSLQGHPGPEPEHEVASYEDQHRDLLVRVCGPIGIDGGRNKLPQRETSVVAYVALNGGADIDRIRDAVWAGVAVSRKRVQNVISTVRASVGDAIAWSGTGRLVAGAGLVTDLELIRRRMAFADHQQDPERKIQVLEGALDLVTGQACYYPSSRKRLWTWVSLDNWRVYVESVVGSLTSQLARLYLDVGNGNGACRVASKGSDAIGRRDELTILLVRGYELQGDEAAARSVVRAHEQYLDELGVEEFNEDLLELLDQYAAPARHKAGG